MRYIQAMTLQAREAIAAEFLRKSLAVEAVGVPELDMMACAAGLLGERQRITDAKAFRRAKARSEYDPFGMASVQAVDGLGSYPAVLRKESLAHRRSFLSQQSGSCRANGWTE